MRREKTHPPAQRNGKMTDRECALSRKQSIRQPTGCRREREGKEREKALKAISQMGEIAQGNVHYQPTRSGLSLKRFGRQAAYHSNPPQRSLLHCRMGNVSHRDEKEGSSRKDGRRSQSNTR
jgi:hypothetical protein